MGRRRLGRERRHHRPRRAGGGDGDADHPCRRPRRSAAAPALVRSRARIRSAGWTSSICRPRRPSRPSLPSSTGWCGRRPIPDERRRLARYLGERRHRLNWRLEVPVMLALIGLRRMKRTDLVPPGPEALAADLDRFVATSPPARRRRSRGRASAPSRRPTASPMRPPSATPRSSAAPMSPASCSRRSPC